MKNGTILWTYYWGEVFDFALEFLPFRGMSAELIIFALCRTPRIIYFKDKTSFRRRRSGTSRAPFSILNCVVRGRDPRRSKALTLSFRSLQKSPPNSSMSSSYRAFLSEPRKIDPKRHFSTLNPSIPKTCFWCPKP